MMGPLLATSQVFSSAPENSRSGALPCRFNPWTAAGGPRSQRASWRVKVVIELGVLLLWVVAAATPLKAAETVEVEIKALWREIGTLRARLEEQGVLLRSIHDYLDSEGYLTYKLEETRMDKAFAMEVVAAVSDRRLTSSGAANPVVPEFAVINSSGGVSFFDVGGKLKRTLTESNQTVTAIAFSPDGEFLVAGTKEESILVWDLKDGRCQVVATNLGAPVARVAWMGGTQRIAWGASVSHYGAGGKPINRGKKSGGVLDRATSRVLWNFQAAIKEKYQSIHSSPDGSTLAVLEVLGRQRCAYLLDGTTGDVVHELQDDSQPEVPISVCIGPDNRTIATGCAPYGIVLWKGEKHKIPQPLEGHSNWVVSLAFSLDGKRLISGAGDSTARVWDVEVGRELGRLRFKGNSVYVYSVAFTPDGRHVFALVDGLLTIARNPY
jgi:hypothetical protein